MTDRVLFVDDDVNLLAALRRQFRQELALETAVCGEDGLAVIRDSAPFAVVVSDMRMPGMTGTEFLKEVHRRSPDASRILLTGYADLQTAIDAVNDGHVFRFLTKPCPPDALRAALRSGVDQYCLITAQRNLLETTLGASLKVLSDVLQLCNPRAFGKTARLQKLVASMAEVLALSDLWKLNAAASLALLGCVSIPDQLLAKMETEERLTLDEEEMIRRHPGVGHELLAAIPRMGDVAESVRYQNRRYDGWDDTGLTFYGPQIPQGARLLKVALDYDSALQKGLGPRAAYQDLEAHATYYDPAVLAALKEAVARDDLGEVVPMKASSLKPGMILRNGLFNRFGARLIAEGLEVTPALLSRIKNMSQRGMVVEPFDVWLPTPLARELAETAVSEREQVTV